MLQRFSKNSFKILICLILVINFVIIEPKEKAEAALPIIPILTYAISGLVIDKATQMGIGFIDKKSAKKVSNDITGVILTKYGDEIKKYPPTKKGVGKALLKFGGFILAEIVSQLAFRVGDKKDDDSNSVEGYRYLFSRNQTLPPLNIDYYIADSDISKYVVVNPYDFTSSGTDYVGLELCFFSSCYRGLGYTPSYLKSAKTFKANPPTLNADYSISIGYYYYNSTGNNVNTWSPIKIGGTDQTVRDQIKRSVTYINDTTNNVTVNNNYGIVYNGPVIKSYDMDKIDAQTAINTDWSKVFNEKELEFEFDLDFKDYPDLQLKFDELEIDAPIDLDISEWFEKKENDFDFEVQPLPPVGDGGLSDEQIGNIDIEIGSGMKCVENGVVVPCDEVEEIDGSLLAYVANAYKYATGVIKTGVDGLKALGTGAVELTKLYGVFFGWLPKEIVVLMTSGLAIMLGLRIFRK